MLGIKKEASQLSENTVDVAGCPVCHSVTVLVYYMQDAESKKRSKWYSCACGIVWNKEFPKKVYDKKYFEETTGKLAKLTDAWKYPVHIYAPIIEEATYGRRALLIGHSQPHQAEAFANRGWVPFSIDKNVSFEATDRLIPADFETFEFPPHTFEDIDGNTITKPTTYNLIWAYHTLECFRDPISALAKIKDLLAEDGILFLGTPDTDFIHTRSSAGFKHWKPDMNHIMWNRTSLKTHLESLGFEIITMRRNYEYRFPYQDDIHLIAQRRFF